MIRYVDDTTSRADTIELGARMDRPRESEQDFDQLIAALHDRGAVGGAQQFAEVARRAQDNQRLTDDDLRRSDDETDERDDYLSGRQKVLEYGAIEIALAELGLGRLSAILGTTISAGTTVDAPNTTASAQLIDPPGAELPAKQPDLAEGELPKQAKPDRTQERAQNDREVEAPPVVKSPSLLAELQGRAALARASSLKNAEPTLLREASPAAGEAKPFASSSSSSQLPASVKIAEILRPPDTSSSQGDSRGEAGADLRGGQDKLDFAKSLAKADDTEALPKGVRKQALNDVLRVLRSNIDRQHSVIKLQLSPPELGKLTIDLRLDGNEMRVKIEAENSLVRDMLRDGSGVLRDALQEQGISIERFEVLSSDEPAARGSFGEELGAFASGEGASSEAGEGQFAEQGAEPLLGDEDAVAGGEFGVGSVGEHRVDITA